DICAERAYNVVKLGTASRRVLAHLEGARVMFNVEMFRRDFEVQAERLDAARRSTSAQGDDYQKLQGFVSNHNAIYQQTNRIPFEALPDNDDYDGSPLRPLSGFRWIKSRFFRATNRRYHAANFWPERVPKEFRARWFRVWTPTPELEVSAFDPNDPP